VTRHRLVRAFWLGAAALLVAAALVAVVALVRGELTDTDGRILLTLGALGLAGALALAGLALADTGRARLVGWAAAAAAPVAFAILASWIWAGLAGETREKVGLTTIALVIGLLALVAQLLLLASRRLLPLVLATALFLAAAVGGTVAAMWTEPESTGWAKVLAVLWVLAALGWFLLPVLQRYTAAGVEQDERVLGELDGIELVATRRQDELAIDARLARGERLLLRRRPTALAG
jgi:hypothetical protein